MFNDPDSLGDMLKQAQQIQEEMQKMQEEMAAKQITADAGAGMVQATVNGRLELTCLKIDKTRIDVNDTGLLEDVIVAAVQAAQHQAARVMEQEMQKAATGLGLPPGLLPE
jgi:DNA-binding YbaB/EbfC family protein